MNIHPDHFTNADMTQTDHDNHEAGVLGELSPEAAWVLTDRDVWHTNPNYQGLAMPHPEDSIWELDGAELACALYRYRNPAKLAPAPVLAAVETDSCPF